MTKSYNDITKRVAGNMAKLRKDIPQTSQSFSDLAAHATADGVLDKKQKELIHFGDDIAYAANSLRDKDNQLGTNFEGLAAR